MSAKSPSNFFPNPSKVQRKVSSIDNFWKSCPLPSQINHSVGGTDKQFRGWNPNILWIRSLSLSAHAWRVSLVSHQPTQVNIFGKCVCKVTFKPLTKTLSHMQCLQPAGFCLQHPRAAHALFQDQTNPFTPRGGSKGRVCTCEPN